MKILFCGPADSPLVSFLKTQDEVDALQDRIDPTLVTGYDFLVSYGYRHIIKQDVLDCFGEKAINLHIAYLPWNRGADPNLWSFVEDSPKGVTIHLLDAGVDTGAILAQEQVEMRPDDTLATSYARLQDAIQALFKKHWPEIRAGKLKARPQASGGSCHRVKDKERLAPLLTRGWDTPVSELLGASGQLPLPPKSG